MLLFKFLTSRETDLRARTMAERPPDDDYELAWRLQREEQLAFQKEQERQRGGSGARAAAGDGRGRLLMEYVQQLESAMEPRE